MSATRIEFAHKTINPLVGCSRKSPGCDNCYAVHMARRHEGNPKVPQYHGLTRRDAERNRIDWTGEVHWVPGVLEKAVVRLARSKADERLFLCSMSDLCHEKATVEHLARVLAFAHALPRHKHIIITKRPDLLAQRIALLAPEGKLDGEVWDAARRPLYDACMNAAGEHFRADRNSRTGLTLQNKAEYIGQMGGFVKFPLPNVMLMATTEDQSRADERIPVLLNLAAKGWHTGVIVEPMLGPVSLTRIGADKPNIIDALRGEMRAAAPLSLAPSETEHFTGISWVVCGAEQGPGKRMIPTSYHGQLAKQCAQAGVSFFFKKDSWGEHNFNGIGSCRVEQFPAWMLCGGEVGDA